MDTPEDAFKIGPAIKKCARGDSNLSILFAYFFHPLLATASLSATDKRDKLYSLLGIINRIRPRGVKFPMLVTYAAEPMVVFLHLSKLILQLLGRLIPLSLASGSRCPSSSDIPSWAIDPGNSPRLGSRELSLLDEDFDAWPLLESGSDTLPLYLENEVLSVEGVEFDALIYVAPLPVESDFTIIAAFLEFSRRLPDAYKYTRESRAKALSLTMAANAFGNKDVMPFEIGSTFWLIRLPLGFEIPFATLQATRPSCIFQLT